MTTDTFTEKRCWSCLKTKPSSEFAKNRAECRLCWNKRIRDYMESHPEQLNRQRARNNAYRQALYKLRDHYSDHFRQLYVKELEKLEKDG